MKTGKPAAAKKSIFINKLIKAFHGGLYVITDNYLFISADKRICCCDFSMPIFLSHSEFIISSLFLSQVQEMFEKLVN